MAVFWLGSGGWASTTLSYRTLEHTFGLQSSIHAALCPPSRAQFYGLLRAIKWRQESRRI